MKDVELIGWAWVSTWAWSSWAWASGASFTRTGKVLRPLLVRWEFPSPRWIKINIDGDILVLLLVEEFSMGVWGVYWFFLWFLEVQTVMVTKFYGIIHAMEEAQKTSLLMYGLNVILPWFVLHLLLELMLCGCFVIDGILVLIIVGKSGLELLIFFVKGMCVLISWLI